MSTHHHRQPHHSQHARANTRYLEVRRRALLAELRRVNAELRRSRPVVRTEDGEWNFDPRQAGGVL